MGKPRKNQPDYKLGFDSIGRQSWKNAATTPPARPTGQKRVPPPAPSTQTENEYIHAGGYLLPAITGEQWEAASPDLHTNLENENLSGLRISKVNLRNAKCSNINISHFFIDSSDMTGADMRRSHGKAAAIHSTNISDTNWQKSDLVELELEYGFCTRTDFSYSHIPYATFTKNHFVDSKFVETDMSYTEFIDSAFEGADFTGANLTGASFFNTQEFFYRRLENISFQGANLTDTKFDGVTLSGVNLTNANLTGAQFKGVTLHHKTNLPFDVTNSNITTKQIQSILAGPGGTEESNKKAKQLVYTRYTANDIRDVTGWTTEELTVHIWAGDIEVRDNITQEIVVGSYDKNRHHIPQWTLADLK